MEFCDFGQHFVGDVASGGDAAPAELRGADVGDGLAHEEVIFDEGGVDALLGDGVAADGEGVVGFEDGVRGAGGEGRKAGGDQECREKGATEHKNSLSG